MCSWQAAAEVARGSACALALACRWLGADTHAAVTARSREEAVSTALHPALRLRGLPAAAAVTRAEAHGACGPGATYSHVSELGSRPPTSPPHRAFEESAARGQLGAALSCSGGS